MAAIGVRLRGVGCGLVGSSRATILWSLACHTFPSPRLESLGASADHGGGCLVSGDVLIGGAPVRITPDTGIGGIDREQFDTGSVGLGGQPAAEYCGGDPGHGSTEPFPTPAAAHGFAPGGAGISEVEVFHGDGVDVVALGVADQAGDRVADLGIPAC